MNTDRSIRPINFDRYLRLLDDPISPVASGVVTEVIGLLIESKGPAVAIGDFCEISTSSGRAVRVQVIGFRNGHVLSMPLEETGGLQLGDRIVARSKDAESLADPVCSAGFWMASDGRSITAVHSKPMPPTS